MVKWTRLGPDVGAEVWASLLHAATDRSPFQAQAWGEYKKRYGWEPQRWVAFNGHEKPFCCLQVLKKRLPLNRTLAWVPAGPLIGFPESQTEMLGELVAGWLTEFRRHNKLLYVRFFSSLHSCAAAAYGLNRICARPSVRINSGFTIQLDLAQPVERLRAGMTSKHRYYVKRSEEEDIEWRAGSSRQLIDDLAMLHQEMRDTKKLGHMEFSQEHLEALQESFGEDCLVLIGYYQQRPVTGCLTLTTKGNAFYLVAATNQQGRAISAAYAMVVKLLASLKEKGITQFDFGGIAPASLAASGVNHFKRGFGGELVEYLGEWEWVSSPSVRWGANYLIQRTKRM